MTVHDTRLPHVLPPQSYWCNEQYEREISSLFAPAWNMVGTWQQLAHDGDFITRDLRGTPLLIRNFQGRIHTFLNVCPHRHCLLTHEPWGNSAELICQYHGWQFKQTGQTGRIPDAQSFRPMPDGPECLKKFRTVVRGPLVLVSLDNDADEFCDQHQLAAPWLDEMPAQRWRLADHWSYNINANWKVVVENTVESYHVSAVHPTTLVRFDEEEHEIHANAGIMRASISAPAWYRRVSNWLLPQFDPGGSHRYRLYHAFPNLFLIRIDTMLQVMAVEPLSSETCRLDVWVFTLRAERETLFSRLLTSAWGRLKCRSVRKILSEDGAVYPDLQRGLRRSPFQGTISTREELVYSFQDYVYRHTAQTISLPTGIHGGGDSLSGPRNRTD